MKRLLNIIIAAVMVAISIPAFAADNADATAVLDRAVKKVNLNKGTQMNFAISGAKINQSGTIMVKGNKFRATTPLAMIWYDGNTQWTYNRKSDEVNIAKPSASQQQTMNPYSFLNLYKQGYAKTMTTTKGGYTIHLTGKGKSISEMYVTIDKKYDLKQVKIKQGGNWITISVSNIKTVALPDSYFRFNSKDYPKAEVIDLR